MVINYVKYNSLLLNHGAISCQQEEILGDDNLLLTKITEQSIDS